MRAVVAMQISNKIDLQSIIISRDKEHCLRIKGSVYGEQITIINLYTQQQSPKVHEANTNRIEGKIDSSTVTGVFNTPLSLMDRMTSQKPSKERELKQYYKPDLTDIYGMFHQQQQNAHSSQVHTECSPRQMMLGHKTSLSKVFKKL